MKLKKKILVVDDEEVIRASLARDLEYQGFSVDKAEDGRQAILLLEKYEYDLVVTDLIMPDRSGIDVLRKAKSAPQPTGVFILTGYGDMESAIEALRLGADDYVLKPCNPEELFLRIESFIEKQEALRTIQLYENILPICAYCKSIRDDTNVVPGKGEWVSVETYISRKSGAMLSHGICPKCFEEHKDD